MYFNGKKSISLDKKRVKMTKLVRHYEYYDLF